MCLLGIASWRARQRYETGTTIAIPRSQLLTVRHCEKWLLRCLAKTVCSMSPETIEQHSAGITPADVRWYALGRGWKSLRSRNDAIAIFVKPESNVQIQVPQRGSDHDIAVMMKEVLRKLSELEGRQLDEVSQDLRNPFADALRLRVKSRLAVSGTLPLLEGLKLFEGGRKLLVSAACAAVTPQAFYLRKSLKQVDEFIAKCQVGQTAIEATSLLFVSSACPIITDFI